VFAQLASGKNVISTAGYFAPEFRGQDAAERLQTACHAGEATLMGSGVEPGFMFDRVAPMVTGMCTDVDHLRLVEVIEAAKHPAAVMMQEALGIGQPLDSITKDSPFGQYFTAFFSEMATAVARALDVRFDEIESGVDVRPRRAISRSRSAPSRRARSRVTNTGSTANHSSESRPTGSSNPASSDGRHPTIATNGPSRSRAAPRSGWSSTPYPASTARVRPTTPGFHATAATAVNAIQSICDAPPGLFHQPVFAPWRSHNRNAARVA
jgi:hypothetical protein